MDEEKFVECLGRNEEGKEGLEGFFMYCFNDNK